MIDCKKIIIEDIIENHMTVVEATNKNNCSESTIRNYIRKLKNSKELADINLYKQYLDASRENQKRGREKGGKIGKRQPEKTKEEIVNLYQQIINHDYTLRKLEELYGIPTSTLYENFIKYLDKEQLLILHDIFEKHHRNGLNDYNNDTENSASLHKVGSEISKPYTTFRK